MNFALWQQVPDLGERCTGGRVDAGHAGEVENNFLQASFRDQGRHPFEHGIGRAEEQIAVQLQDLDLSAMLEKKRALSARADQGRRSFVEAELMTDDADPADIDCEYDAARQQAEEERL